MNDMVNKEKVKSGTVGNFFSTWHVSLTTMVLRKYCNLVMNQTNFRKESKLPTSIP
uniref:Uncharacterized protein n=1 Tax=Arundo donax TaxID=35708 RepID=A0A0A9EHC9_ARUDO